MTGTVRVGSAANTDDLLALPLTPSWRKPLIFVIAGLTAFLTVITIDLARTVGWREAVLIVVTVALVAIGWWMHSRPWSPVALVLAVAAGALGFRFRADGDLDALHAGLGGMIQYGAAGAILLLAAALTLTELLHARNARRGR